MDKRFLELRVAIGGGFLLIFAEPDKHSYIAKKLEQYIYIPFTFDFKYSRRKRN